MSNEPLIKRFNRIVQAFDSAVSEILDSIPLLKSTLSNTQFIDKLIPKIQEKKSADSTFSQNECNAFQSGLLSRLKRRSLFRNNLALRGGWQGNPQAVLQPLQPIPREPAAVTQQRDHARCRGIVLLFAHSLRSLGSEDSSAEITAQSFQFIYSRVNRRLSLDAHQHTGVVL